MQAIPPFYQKKILCYDRDMIWRLDTRYVSSKYITVF